MTNGLHNLLYLEHKFLCRGLCQKRQEREDALMPMNPSPTSLSKLSNPLASSTRRTSARTPEHAEQPPDRGVHIERLTTGFASPAEDYLEAPLDL